MGRKRRAEEEPPSLEQVLAAVQGRRQHILQHAATVSTSQLLQWAADDLGLPSTAPLRPHRRAAAQLALEMLEEQVGGLWGSTTAWACAERASVQARWPCSLQLLQRSTPRPTLPKNCAGPGAWRRRAAQRC